MTTEPLRRSRALGAQPADDENWLVPDPDHAALLKRIRIELEVLDRQIHHMKNTIEWEAPRTGLSSREEAIMIREIVASLMKDSATRSAWHLGSADYESIIRTAQEKGIPPARVDAWLKKLEAARQVYRPSKDRFLLVKPLR